MTLGHAAVATAPDYPTVLGSVTAQPLHGDLRIAAPAGTIDTGWGPWKQVATDVFTLLFRIDENVLRGEPSGIPNALVGIADFFTNTALPEPPRTGERVHAWREAADYRPRTTLGAHLLELRKQILASGVPLLDWDDLERERADRWGEER